ncbi:MAG TPA: DUF1697 domain-containing protein [Candidatus Cybelea sp.]|nr:DUF1697 domain-containing protein [Candidatus Cybelea sp.]
MQTYICIIRGINVVGCKIIKMEALRRMFEALKFKNAQTYIQSGNVIFQDKKTDGEVLAKKIAKRIQADFGFDVPVMVKEPGEMKEVLRNNPFVGARQRDVAKMHVTFLSHEPAKEGLEKIKAGNYGVDEYVIWGKAIYLFCPDGYGNTKLNNNFLESKLKVTATTRNWRTVNELVRIAESVCG